MKIQFSFYLFVYCIAVGEEGANCLNCEGETLGLDIFFFADRKTSGECCNLVLDVKATDRELCFRYGGFHFSVFLRIFHFREQSHFLKQIQKLVSCSLVTLHFKVMHKFKKNIFNVLWT